jgi:hypothetical protein
MKNLISDHVEFFQAVSAILLGSIIGFSSTHFIQKKINEHVQNTCEKKIISVKMLFTTESLYCVD